MKKKFSTELAYVLGVLIMAAGTALMERADFGVSMVVAPAYLIYLKLSEVWSFVTFGMAEYTFQALLLIVMMLIVRKFKVSYLFSIVTAVIYGFVLDGCMLLLDLGDFSSLAWRIALYFTGLVVTAAAVALMFRTYISPAVYELFVKVVATEKKLSIDRFKLGYDMVSCIVGVALSFIFFGLFVFRGVNIGTVVAALLNGWIIKGFGALMDKHWDFSDSLKLRKYFE